MWLFSCFRLMFSFKLYFKIRLLHWLKNFQLIIRHQKDFCDRTWIHFFRHQCEYYSFTSKTTMPVLLILLLRYDYWTQRIMAERGWMGWGDENEIFRGERVARFRGSVHWPPIQLRYLWLLTLPSHFRFERRCCCCCYHCGSHILSAAATESSFPVGSCFPINLSLFHVWSNGDRLLFFQFSQKLSQGFFIFLHEKGPTAIESFEWVSVEYQTLFWAAAPKGRCPVGHRGEFPDVRPSVLPSFRPSPPPPRTIKDPNQHSQGCFLPSMPWNKPC